MVDKKAIRSLLKNNDEFHLRCITDLNHFDTELSLTLAVIDQLEDKKLSHLGSIIRGNIKGMRGRLYALRSLIINPPKGEKKNGKN